MQLVDCMTKGIPIWLPQLLLPAPQVPSGTLHIRCAGTRLLLAALLLFGRAPEPEFSSILVRDDQQQGCTTILAGSGLANVMLYMSGPQHMSGPQSEQWPAMASPSAEPAPCLMLVAALVNKGRRSKLKG